MKVKKTAFTLIETIIAIVVFGIGILTVLIGLSQTLKNKDYANTQIKSAFFAREWIELMFNLRDANYHKEMPRNCVFKNTSLSNNWYDEDYNPFCEKIFDDGIVLKVWMGDNNQYLNTEIWTLSNDFETDFEKFQIYVHTWNILNWNVWFIYNYDQTNGEKTWFARYLIIKWVMENGNMIPKDKLLKIESHVLYKRWEFTGEKVMETFIGNYEFKDNLF